MRGRSTMASSRRIVSQNGAFPGVQRLLCWPPPLSRAWPPQGHKATSEQVWLHDAAVQMVHAFESLGTFKPLKPRSDPARPGRRETSRPYFVYGKASLPPLFLSGPQDVPCHIRSPVRRKRLTIPGRVHHPEDGRGSGGRCRNPSVNIKSVYTCLYLPGMVFYVLIHTLPQSQCH